MLLVVAFEDASPYDLAIAVVGIERSQRFGISCLGQAHPLPERVAHEQCEAAPVVDNLVRGLRSLLFGKCS